MKRKARMRLDPEKRKEAEVAQRQFSLAKALFYNGWLTPDQLPHIHQWRGTNKFDAEVIAAAVAPFEDNMRRAFNNVILRVHVGETEVCFNCLQPFVENDTKGRATLHHLLPRRFRGLPHYNTQVPVVRAHRKCTDGWHSAYDPCRFWIEDAAIWSVEEYLTEARKVQFGFGMYAGQGLRHHPELRIARGLLPFLLGTATISYDQPKEPSYLVYPGNRTEIAKALGLPSLANLPSGVTMPLWQYTSAV